MKPILSFEIYGGDPYKEQLYDQNRKGNANNECFTLKVQLKFSQWQTKDFLTAEAILQPSYTNQCRHRSRFRLPGTGTVLQFGSLWEQCAETHKFVRPS